MVTKKKEWGAKTAWSMSFFDMMPPVAGDIAACEPTLAAAAPASSHTPLHDPTSLACDDANKSAGASRSSSDPPPHSKPYKERKRQELDLRTRWRCRRCGVVLQPPLDAATGKPRYGVMMTEHLEGVSSGGTSRLATGVVVCAAGTMRYDKAVEKEAVFSHAQSSKRPRADAGEGPSSGQAPEAEAVIASTRQPRHVEEDSSDKNAAREAVRRQLRECQQRARQLGSSDASPSPLIFIVVENPKTPANAGGILRAMRCYGLRGPAAAAATVAVATETAAPLPTPATPRTAEEPTDSRASGSTSMSAAAQGVAARAEEAARQRVGSFIFSGTRLRRAMMHSEYAHTLRTDPTHAGRDIPQLCVPTLDVLFDVLRDDYGFQKTEPRSPSPASVRVVAVELVEGAVPLPFYEHPFSCPTTQATGQLVDNDAAPNERAAAPADVHLPMVFYVLGAEDGTLSAHHLQRDVHDVVFMPTTGSMNLAATVNVLLYDRFAKEFCGVRPGVADARLGGSGWKDVFDARNPNNRIRWTGPFQ
ncbi:hypothetical protein LSCM4_04887 [Leishmania orientalis]|uniref:tRNA/rRNA methyltransferase SpoU type domain-containing protein n=1 Tax=Leishmania orientalis TaxID=2249476 RepID=A0A836HGJ4_9TRYP|nr:hypothetical protein LSCM4_04887 [Leishmania orientalis]